MKYFSSDHKKPETDTVAGKTIDPLAQLLKVDNLHVEFQTNDTVVRAVNGLSYSLNKGETVAILGESGSGKSVAAQAVMGILETPPAKITKGEVRFKGVDLLLLSERDRRSVRARRIAMIFQDSLTSLNPVFTVGWQIQESFRKHQGMKKAEAKERSIDLLDLVGIPSARQRMRSYPHEFSGGMRQRVMIAMSLALDPEVLIADEPTTALDVTIQAQIMKLLRDLQDKLGMGLVLITHDLGVVAEVADQVVMMYAGREVETSDVFSLYRQPLHPYTSGLLASVPRIDGTADSLHPIVGQPPNLTDLAPGCSFSPRCPKAQELCSSEVPLLRNIPDDPAGRIVACHFPNDSETNEQN